MKKLFWGYHFPMSVYWEAQKNGGFTQLSLDFTSKCNYQCDWCFNKKLLNIVDEDILGIEARKKLITQSNFLGAKTLVVPGTGEPTLDINLKETIRHAYNLGMTTVIYSNLTGEMDSELLRWMYNHDVSLGIKLDSFQEEHFINRYHTTIRKYKVFRKNLDEIVRVYANSKVEIGENEAHRVIANMVLTKENLSEIKEISKFCRESDLPLFVRPVKPVDWANDNLDLWKKLGNGASVLYPEQELLDVANEYNTLFSPSSTIENHCAIYSFGLTVKGNGDVQLCPDHHDSRGVYNVCMDSLEKIIRDLNKDRVIRPKYCLML